MHGRLVPGGSGKVYAHWLTDRGAAFLDKVQIAALDAFLACCTTSRSSNGDTEAVNDTIEPPASPTATATSTTTASTCPSPPEGLT